MNGSEAVPEFPGVVDPLTDAADAIDADEDLALNIVLGGPAYVTYWLRERAAALADAVLLATQRDGLDDFASALREVIQDPKCPDHVKPGLVMARVMADVRALAASDRAQDT